MALARNSEAQKQMLRTRCFWWPACASTGKQMITRQSWRQSRARIKRLLHRRQTGGFQRRSPVQRARYDRLTRSDAILKAVCTARFELAGVRLRGRGTPSGSTPNIKQGEEGAHERRKLRWPKQRGLPPGSRISLPKWWCCWRSRGFRA